MTRTRYVIIGGGAAALSAAGAIRKRDPEGPVTVISAEKHPPYFRPLISYYLAGQVERNKLFLRTEDYYDRSGIRRLNARAVAVHGRQGMLLLEMHPVNGVPEKAELQFDRLLIATGAEPVKPDLPGLDYPGVHFLRTLDDAAAIGRRAAERHKAVIVGGGLVSLRAACALKKLGLDITVVVSSARVLSRMLDPQGSALVSRHLEEKGITVRLQSDVARLHGGDSGLEGVTLTDGTELEAGVAVIGKGVKPAVSFLEGSAVEVSGGIPVNEKLQTNLPQVYAAGDAALCRELLSGKPASYPLWPNALTQGEIAGANMAGAELTYDGTMGMNATEILGLPVMAAGLVEPDESDPSVEVYSRHFSPGRGDSPLYTKIVIRDNMLAGYVAVGAHRKAGILTNLIGSRQALSPYRKEQFKQGKVPCL